MKRTVCILLCLVLILGLLPVFGVAAGEVQEIYGMTKLKEAMEKDGDVSIRLTGDVIASGKTLPSAYITLGKGKKVLDLNGHSMEMNDEDSKACTFLYIGEGASLTVNDSSVAKNGRIFAYGKMDTISSYHHYYNIKTRDCIRVDGGELTVNAGSLESGRTKEYWAYDACNVGNWGYETWTEYEIFSNIVGHCHYRIDGYYNQIIGGDCIRMESGAVTINGGKIMGRGYRYMDTRPDTSTMDKVVLTAERAAGVYAKAGKLTINGGQISGMANANALEIQPGVNVSITAGVFYTQLISKVFVPDIDSKAAWTHQLVITYNDTFRLNRPDPGSGAGSLGFPSDLLQASKHEVTLDGKTLYPDYWKPKYITNTEGDGGHTLVVNSKAAQAVYTYNPADLAPKDIAAADLSGLAAYDGYIDPDTIICPNTGVKSAKSQWYCGNEALTGKQKVGFGIYYANVTLTAEELYRFTSATRFTVNGQAPIATSISGNGRYAHVWTSPATFECDHRMNTDTSVHYDADRHYQQCSVCGKIYMTEPHVMDSGTANGKLTTYACLSCGFTRTTENGREGVNGVVVQIPVAMIGEKIPAPTMEDGYNAYGKIMSYEWRKGNSLESAVGVNVGDAYEASSVYYMIVRVKANDGYYFNKNAVISCNTGVKQGVDGDSEVLIGTYRVVPTSSAPVVLSVPALKPGQTLETFCKGISATVGNEKTSNFEIAIYRNGSDKYSFIKWSIAKDWSFYSGEGGDLNTVFAEKILPDTPYRFTISVSTNGKFVPTEKITYATGSKCEGALLSGGETWAEVDLHLLSNSNRISDIPIVNVAAPVTGEKPDVTFDVSAEAVGLTAEIGSWNTTGAFEAGKAYTFTGKVKLQSGFSFEGVPTATVNSDAAAVTVTGDTATVSYTFPATKKPTVTVSGSEGPVVAPAQKDNPFTDVKNDAYYTDAVLWAYYHEPQVTNGTSADKFSPDATCTRGQVVTFLWRANGCPEPKSLDNPFKDVATSAWYFKPVLWAVEQKITNGTSADQFSPNQTCSFAHVLTFLYRAAGSPGAENSPNRQWYHDALTWAVNNKLITGTGLERTVYPTDPCPRCDVVTYLYRHYGSK